MNEWDDTYYIKKILDGHTEYFARLVDRYSHCMYVLILKIVRSKEEAEEITQDVFLKHSRIYTNSKKSAGFPPGSTGLPIRRQYPLPGKRGMNFCIWKT